MAAAATETSQITATADAVWRGRLQSAADDVEGSITADDGWESIRRTADESGSQSAAVWRGKWSALRTKHELAAIWRPPTNATTACPIAARALWAVQSDDDALDAARQWKQCQSERQPIQWNGKCTAVWAANEFAASTSIFPAQSDDAADAAARKWKFQSADAAEQSVCESNTESRA